MDNPLIHDPAKSQGIALMLRQGHVQMAPPPQREGVEYAKKTRWDKTDMLCECDNNKKRNVVKNS